MATTMTSECITNMLIAELVETKATRAVMSEVFIVGVERVSQFVGEGNVCLSEDPA